MSVTLAVWPEGSRPEPEAAPDTVGRPGRLAIDVPRLGICTVFILIAMSNILAFVNVLVSPMAWWDRVAQLVAGALAFTFAVWVVRAYLRRGPAQATDRSALVRAAAFCGTFGPVALGVALPGLHGGITKPVSLALTVMGVAFSVYCVRTLSTNISVVPQARELVVRGPYRLVRHPLYLGELFAMGGMSLHGGWGVAVVATTVEAGVQIFRALAEERLLGTELPGYAAYAARTRRLFPGVW
jgi:protein-S-isoprenylcysteine O-methyltransferase Ste14